ncbi:LysR family transcriptional regulator [Pseudidiomarina donghaiensis]|uniref:LysR family transcriptional regulator n=1 Tax=Pseudidiomarina donghaiensis TaxID=519452 RepID=A0A432XH00_9GAMM|nr:LysR family transcriptional regulator [Pseudidiomarina donghaiensis]RUO48023.1 LysR family transcriptional regulator [Pseudidiomarina donghaiensis]SFV22789.1 transcriptional regulator, LysR family [Pseudidiomarina donghaiensis]
MDIRHLNFRLLDVFIEVVESRSISAAARRMFLTQPTVSAQVKRLEELFGSRLLYQEGRYMLPTTAGEQVYQAAGDVLRRVQSCADTLAAIESGTHGELHIALVNTAQYIVPQLVAQFNRTYPGIRVTLHIGNRANTLQRYFQGQDDVYLFSHPPTDENADAQAFIENPLVLIAPSDHWAVNKTELKFSQLQHEPFLMRENGSATRMVFDSWLASQGIHLRYRSEIESNEAILLSVAAGSGLAVLSKHIVAHANDPVATLNVAGFPLPGQWYIVSRRDNQNQAIIERFRQLV